MREVAWLFLRLGTIAFGGPAAHIAMMHDELVRRRGWLTEQRFLDLLGASNLIPGPTSTELAIHIGHERAGWRGLVAAGACFILPATVMVGALAHLYVTYGSTPAVHGVLYGIKPVVIAIIFWALRSLVRTALKTPFLWALAVAVLVAYLLGLNELVLLAAGGAVTVLVRLSRSAGPGGPAARAQGLLAWPLAALAGNDQLVRLFLTMLKIGAVLYGGGYVLLAFLHGDFVERLHWLTDTQLTDAIAIGQVTPGPVFTTATFVGYLVAGVPGAVLATVGIFLPSFLLVGLLTKLTDKIRSKEWSSALLDGVNAAALALMAGVGAQLAHGSLVDPLTVILCAAAVLALWRTSLNTTWLILAGGVAGVLHTVLYAH
ncbi:chromate efflux transporter [Planotetraspora sp. GP83]|uniref:chromate efflux transporter n=1 Tax=Planotetraspora sp. GP83 TaxID=3156264 RepID=UPI003514853C